MKAMIKTFSLLSDETRLRIINLLTDGEACVCEVMKALDITQSTASRCLTALYDAGLLIMRRDGPWSLYSIKWDGMSSYQSKVVNIIIEEMEKVDIVVNDRKNMVEARQNSPRAILASLK